MKVAIVNLTIIYVISDKNRAFYNITQLFTFAYIYSFSNLDIIKSKISSHPLAITIISHLFY